MATKTTATNDNASSSVSTSTPSSDDMRTGLRTHDCGVLRMSNVGETVTLSGWVQKARDMNHFVFIDLRDRFGITQCIFNNPNPEKSDRADAPITDDAAKMYAQAQKLGREFVIQVTGKVVERSAKNANRATGDIEVVATSLVVLNTSKTPPFMIEDDTSAGEDLRLKYRYLDLRRDRMQKALYLRNQVALMVRTSLNAKRFVEVETPVLIKSTPEGARDFVVPSRMNPGCFYALPQSPQTFKQILMVAGIDRYFQIVKCFRDEDLRNDRQPEFTQIDCEMSFVKQEDVLSTFEQMIANVFRSVVGHAFPVPFPRLTYAEAMKQYGIDKPDLRYGMKLQEITDLAQNTSAAGFKFFDEAELVVAIKLDGDAVDQTLVAKHKPKGGGSKKKKKKKKGGDAADASAAAPKAGKYDGISAKDLEKMKVKSWSKKVLTKELDKLCKGEQVGTALFWVRVKKKNADGSLDLDASIKKNFSQDQMRKWCERCGASEEGDVLIIFAGKAHATRECMGKMRHLMGTRLGLRSEGFNALWVVDFPLLEWNEEENRYTAMHHPFTSPKTEDMHLLTKNADGEYDKDKIGRVRANAYDMVINGCEVGGGSIRIHDRSMQSQVFDLLGFSKEEAQKQFGFLMGAFEYGAPPHGGLAFGLDRLCMILGGAASIRDYIAFPKNNQGRDLMIDAPSTIDPKQLEELKVKSTFVSPAEKVSEGVEKMKIDA